MEAIYRFFSFLFGANLAEHLSGWDEATGDYTKANLFSVVGISTLVIAVAVCVVYYYVLDQPRWNRPWIWSLFLIAVAVVGCALAFAVCFSDWSAENFSSDISDISVTDCFGFGLANGMVAAAIFFLCSLAIKWGSRNSKYSPF